jgi:hypothetical protein
MVYKENSATLYLMPTYTHAPRKMSEIIKVALAQMLLSMESSIIL